MFKRNLILINSIILLFGSSLFAQTAQYIGAAKCKMCHNKAATGEQYNKWTASAHSKAWTDLASAKALEVGKKQNIASPQTSAKCLKCHSTASGVDKSLIASLTVEEGVSCETCHGPGSIYKSMTLMKNRDDAVKAGLIIPNEKTCVKCHNANSPTYKPFNFATFDAKIAHKIPK